MSTTTTSSTRLLAPPPPHSTASFTRTPSGPPSRTTIFRCSSGGRYVIAGLRNTIHSEEFKLQRYDSDTGVWTSTLLSVHAPERDEVLPIPRTATQLLFHGTTKAITLGGPRATIGWVDLWRGILLCDVLDEEPVLRDVPLPKPSRANRRSFCRGGPHLRRRLRQSGSDECDLEDDVAPYWKATVWTMPVPVGSWKDWRRDKECRVDVTDITVDNPRHSELLLPLPRLSTDPESATMSLRRLLTAHPTLDLDGDGDLVIYLLSKVDYMDSKGWVIAVGARDKKLRGIAELDSRKNDCFMRCYLHTEMSKYLINATGEVGALVEDADVGGLRK